MGSFCFSQSQITINGNSGGAVSPVSYYQRPFSPSAYSLPASLNSSIIMQHGRSLGKYCDHDSSVAALYRRRKIQGDIVTRNYLTILW